MPHMHTKPESLWKYTLSALVARQKLTFYILSVHRNASKDRLCAVFERVNVILSRRHVETACVKVAVCFVLMPAM